MYIQCTYGVYCRYIHSQQAVRLMSTHFILLLISPSQYKRQPWEGGYPFHPLLRCSRSVRHSHFETQYFRSRSNKAFVHNSPAVCNLLRVYCNRQRTRRVPIMVSIAYAGNGQHMSSIHGPDILNLPRLEYRSYQEADRSRRGRLHGWRQQRGVRIFSNLAGIIQSSQNKILAWVFW